LAEDSVMKTLIAENTSLIDELQTDDNKKAPSSKLFAPLHLKLVSLLAPHYAGFAKSSHFNRYIQAEHYSRR
jgi:hypothetical protein